MKNKILTFTFAVIAIIGLALTAPAQDSNYPALKSQQFIHHLSTPTQSCFQSQELSISLGYTYGTAVGGWSKNDNSPGIDFEGTYWFKREFGIGIDTGLTDTHDVASTLLDHVDGMLNARLPLDDIPIIPNSIGKHLAPEIGVSPFGWDLKDGQYQTLFEGGLIFRFTAALGFDVFYRATFEPGSSTNKDEHDARFAGVRLQFGF